MRCNDNNEQRLSAATVVDDESGRNSNTMDDAYDGCKMHGVTTSRARTLRAVYEVTRQHRRSVGRIRGVAWRTAIILSFLGKFFQSSFITALKFFREDTRVFREYSRDKTNRTGMLGGVKPKIVFFFTVGLSAGENILII